MEASSIILAAGKGTRMNASGNKVFLTLGGHSLLSYSVNIFNKVDYIKEIILVYAEGERDLVADSIGEIALSKQVKYVLGGASRQESVQNGIESVNPSCDYIAIHDGARPFITVDFVKNLLDKAFELNAVIPALPVKDTVKQVISNTVRKTLNRQELYTVQTPQVFNLKVFNHFKNTNIEVTDDASLIENDYSVHVYQGSHFNKKITTPEDMLFAEAVIGKVEEFQW